MESDLHPTARLSKGQRELGILFFVRQLPACRFTASNWMIATQVVQQVKHDSGFDEVIALFVGNARGNKFVPPGRGDHNPQWLMNEALSCANRIRQRREQQHAGDATDPFLLWIADTLPHGDTLQDPLAPEVACRTPSGLQFCSASQRRQLSTRISDKDTTMESRKQKYRSWDKTDGEQLHWPDKNLGLLLDWLDLDSTLLIVTADHGIRSKNHPYADGVTVPLVVSWPAGGIRKHNYKTAPVSLLDIVPTILDA